MAMLGVGCRAPSAVITRPAAWRADMLNPRCWSRNFSPAVPERTGACGQRLWAGARHERNGIVVRSLQQRFFVKAIDVSGPGAVDSPLMQSMQAKIKEDLNAESVIVKDAYGDGRHVSVDVVASVFEGKSAVNRQRMVYKAIWQELQETVHAVDQLKTRTPSEVATSGDQL